MKQTAIIGTLIILSVNLVCYIVAQPPIEMSVALTAIGLSVMWIMLLLTNLIERL